MLLALLLFFSPKLLDEEFFVYPVLKTLVNDPKGENTTRGLRRPIRTTIDLSPSRKLVDPNEVYAGDVLTYTILLCNQGDGYATDTVLWDPIPAATNYITKSAQATSGKLAYTVGITDTFVYTEVINWQGTISPSQAITIMFNVRVIKNTASLPAFIENAAMVTDMHDRHIKLFVDSIIRGDTYDERSVYLPLVLRSNRVWVPILGVAVEGYADEYGINYGLGLNLHWSRRWQPISWAEIEDKRGEYNWDVLTGLESELLNARSLGIEPILEIQYTPEWAQKNPPYTCGPVRVDEFDSFASFMERLVRRYGSKTPYGVRYWQLGNELDVAPSETTPDSIYGCWGDPDAPYYGGGYYAEMLKVVYPRIKEIDPQSQIMMGGLLLECDPYMMSVETGECVSEQRLHSGLFLEGVLHAGGGDYFDVLDVHSFADLNLDLPSRMHSVYAWSGIYGGTGLPEKVEFARQLLREYGFGDKSIFVGEMALRCPEPTDTCLDVAAAFIPRTYAEGYVFDILGGGYWAMIMDYQHKGLISSDYRPLPAYRAYEFLGDFLYRKDYIGPMTTYDNLSGAKFQQGDKTAWILWSTEGVSQTVNVPLQFQAYDKFGKELPIYDGKLTVGWSPIYLIETSER